MTRSTSWKKLRRNFSDDVVEHNAGLIDDLEDTHERPHKYRAKPVVVDGIRFDSRKEARRYKELKTLEQAGLVRDLILQHPFVIVDAFDYRGEKNRAVHYVVDFVYLRDDGVLVAEEVKGYWTREAKLKRKLFLKRYGDEYEYVVT